MGDVTFRESRGLPANEHAKKVAKETNSKKQKRDARNFYTLIDSKKLLLITVKASGLYTSYFGSVKKIGKDVLDVKIKQWKKDGKWVEQGLIDDVCVPIMESMQAEQARR